MLTDGATTATLLLAELTLNIEGCHSPMLTIRATTAALQAEGIDSTMLPRQSAAPASCSSIFNTRICSAVGFAAVRGSARAVATHSPLCPAFHALVWQQQRERVRVGEAERR
jgi:hypothetical protein